MMSQTMVRDSFDRSLQALLEDVLLLGNMAEQAITASVEALNQGDLDASRRIYQEDQRINEKRYAIEYKALKIIATQQPMARDLRFLAAVLEIITELERIADYAKGIAKINILIGPEPTLRWVPEIQQMADLGVDMLGRALRAFRKSDVDAARQIPQLDDQIDTLYQQLLRTMLARVQAGKESIARMNYFLWTAHNLERVSDRVTNICERVVFTVTGEVVELNED